MRAVQPGQVALCDTAILRHFSRLPHLILWRIALHNPQFILQEKTMAKMRAVQVSKAGGNFELVERPIPEPGRNQVRIKVEACGICHSSL